MKKNPSGSFIWMMRQNLPVLMTVLFFFLLGISAGVFTEAFLSPENKESIQSFLDGALFLADLSGISLPDVFLSSLAVNLILLFLIALSGFTVIGFPAALLILVYKGATLGFSSALLMETMGMKGAAAVLLTLAPQNLLLIPAFLTGAMAALSFSFSVLSGRSRSVRKSLSGNAAGYLLLFFALSLLVLGGCLIEAFIGPFLQQLSG